MEDQLRVLVEPWARDAPRSPAPRRGTISGSRVRRGGRWRPPVPPATARMVRARHRPRCRDHAHPPGARRGPRARPRRSGPGDLLRVRIRGDRRRPGHGLRLVPLSPPPVPGGVLVSGRAPERGHDGVHRRGDVPGPAPRTPHLERPRAVGRGRDPGDRIRAGDPDRGARQGAVHARGCRWRSG